jgi:hypothetical protein
MEAKKEVPAVGEKWEGTTPVPELAPAVAEAKRKPLEVGQALEKTAESARETVSVARLRTPAPRAPIVPMIAEASAPAKAVQLEVMKPEPVLKTGDVPPEPPKEQPLPPVRDGQVMIHFATDRKWTGASFNGEWNEAGLTYGRLVVFVKEKQLNFAEEKINGWSKALLNTTLFSR